MGAPGRPSRHCFVASWSANGGLKPPYISPAVRVESLAVDADAASDSATGGLKAVAIHFLGFALVLLSMFFFYWRRPTRKLVA